MATTMPTGTEKGPTSEIGYSAVAPVKWSLWAADVQENAPDLRWPTSVRTYHQMRTDAQLDSLHKAITFPIRRSRWVIDPNGARDEIVEFVASCIGLPIRGVDDPPPRRRRQFKHDDHLRQALLALIYGFMPFEQVGAYEGSGDALRWRLTKLPPRMPQSISNIDTDDNGDLIDIRQWPRPGDPLQGKPIPADSLAMYVWDKEGGNWTGRSIFRSCYRHWLIKDRLLRVDAIKNERFGMGVPYASAPPGASKETIERYAAMARAIRGDALAGVGLPNQGDIGIEGIRGTLPDILGSINYQDEQMARSFLTMFVLLGQSSSRGNRALGESFIDFFKLGVETVSNWYAEFTNDSVIEDIVDWNWGQEETAPLIDWDEDPESQLAAGDLVQMIDAGAIVVDDELRTWISDRWGVVDPGETTPTPPGPSPTTQAVPSPLPGEPSVPAPTPLPAAAASGRGSIGVGRRRHVAAAARTVTRGRRPHNHLRRGSVQARSQTLNSPRLGHRDPTHVELAARTDFAKLQREWDDQTEALVAAYQQVRAQQIEELVSGVEDAVDRGSVEDLAGVMAATDGASVIALHMVQMLESSVVQAKAEAAAQGVVVPTIDTSTVAGRLRTQAGAVADVITRAISNSAATQGLQRYGVSSLSAQEVGQGVRDHLTNLSDSYLNDMLGGAVTQAQNAGRMLVMQQNPGTYYSSELLDENTCEACEEEDGTTFTSVDDALQDYPAGGYRECAGGPRCRGTVVAVYDEASSQED